METPAQGTRGILIWCHVTDRFVFRVYNPENKREFIDYDIKHDDLEVEIMDNYSSLFNNGEDNHIGYPSRLAENAKKIYLQKKADDASKEG